MNSEENNSIKDNVLQAIDSGKVTMKPKWHFITHAVLLITGIIFAMLSLLYLISFIIFTLHQTGLWFAPGFGLRGLRELLFDFPWLLVFVAIIFIALLQVLIKKYSFSYGKPLIYSIMIIVVIVATGGFILSMTSVHKNLFLQAQNNRLPFGGSMYMQYGHPPQHGNITAGEILEALQNGYSINTPQEEILSIIVTPTTKYPLGSNFIIGDKIVVIGERDGYIIQAYGIRKINDNEYIQPLSDKYPYKNMHR